MAGMKKRKHGTPFFKGGDIKITIDGGPDSNFLNAPGGFTTLRTRASKIDIAAAALAQRDRLAAEVEALWLIVKALEAENRRAWAMVRKLGDSDG